MQSKETEKQQEVNEGFIMPNIKKHGGKAGLVGLVFFVIWIYHESQIQQNERNAKNDERYFKQQTECIEANQKLSDALIRLNTTLDHALNK